MFLVPGLNLFLVAARGSTKNFLRIPILLRVYAVLYVVHYFSSQLKEIFNNAGFTNFSSQLKEIFNNAGFAFVTFGCLWLIIWFLLLALAVVEHVCPGFFYFNNSGGAAIGKKKTRVRQL